MKDLARMPKKKEPKPIPKLSPKLSQKERFIEYAKEIGVDEDSEDFERVFGKILDKKIP